MKTDKPMDNNVIVSEQTGNSTVQFDDQNNQPLPGTEIVPVQNTSAVLSGFEKAQIDIQIATAKRFPRSLQEVMIKAESAVSLSPEVAESCFYTLKRRDKTGKEVLIEGPSVRLAEILASAWGNLRVQVFLTDIGKYIRAIANVIDLENNYAYSSETIRRGTDRFGRIYNDDLLIMNANAAMAIAKRNAILNVIPRVLVNQLMVKAQKIAAGSSLSLKDKRERWLIWFENQGIKREQVLHWLGVKTEDEINVEHVKRLAGLKTALEDGETTIEEEFGKKTSQKEEQKPKEQSQKLEETPSEEVVQEQPQSEEEKKQDKSPSQVDILIETLTQKGCSIEQILKFCVKYGYQVDDHAKIPINFAKKLLKNVDYYASIIKTM